MSHQDELLKLLYLLPSTIQIELNNLDLSQLIEVVFDLGRIPEIRYSDRAELLNVQPTTQVQIDEFIANVAEFGGDNRAGIEGTLHRISVIRNRTGKVIGVTCRVGRAVSGTIDIIRDLVESGKSLLMLGRPGVGKTTALREIARVLADDLGKRVVIIDSSNEIAGDGDIPHSAIGRARRLQVSRPELQYQVMIEAVENHTPQVIVIDEISTELEALAARTIAERGVQLIGTAHGNQIENLLKNPTLSDLVGGIQAVTLGDDEARRRGSQKTILERKSLPTFDIAVEMWERQSWIVHTDLATTVDSLLKGQKPNSEMRSLDAFGRVQREPVVNQPVVNNPRPSLELVKPKSDVAEFDHLLKSDVGLESDKLHVYSYGLTRSSLEDAVAELDLPIVITKNIDDADVVLTLKSYLKSYPQLKQQAMERDISVQAIAQQTPQLIARILRQLVSQYEVA